MCGDPETSELSRRNFLRAGAVAATTAALGLRLELPARSAMAAPGGELASAMAMHIHSSFSEQYGSMEAHLFQARQNAVDVLWWTDHDFRMTGRGYRKTVHFTSLTAESGGPGEASAWHWEPQNSGSLAAGWTGGIVDSPASPRDTVARGSLQLRAQSKGSAAATVGFYANSHPAGWNYHCSLLGQSLAIEVLPVSVGPHAYLEIKVTTSYHHAPGGRRPAGNYVLSYRLGGAAAVGSRVATGLTGVVTLPVSTGRWNSVVLRPAEDIAALWPDLDSRDFALYGLNLNAVCSGKAVAAGNFDYLRFTRSSGELQLHTQVQMMQSYAPSYPGVTQRRGLEISYYQPHINWFGGAVTFPQYGRLTKQGYLDYLKNTAIPQIHAAGGLASYNHPFGMAGGPPLPKATQDQQLAALAAAMLGDGAVGCDILEVGYTHRAGIDLAHHVGLWDVLSRNARFITGNGATDDHMAVDWAALGNNWTTSTWSGNRSEASLLSALAAGRAWTSSLSRYRGNMDLLVDGSCPMGSASVSSVSSRRLTATATDVPAGGSLQVLQGKVDYAGRADCRPNSRVVSAYRAGQLAGGAVTTAVDTTADSYVRTQVLDSSGAVVGLSNPVWLLRHAPPGGIPGHRGC